MNKMKTKLFTYTAALVTCGFMTSVFATSTPPSLSDCMSSTTPSVLDACIQNNVCYQYNNGNNGDIQNCVSSLAYQDYVANFTAVTPADPNATSSPSSTSSSGASSGSSNSGGTNSSNSSSTNPASTSGNGSTGSGNAASTSSGGSSIRWF